MWPYGLDLRSIKLTVVKVIVSSEETCNNCSFVEVFNYFLKCSRNIWFSHKQFVISKFLSVGVP